MRGTILHYFYTTQSRFVLGKKTSKINAGESISAHLHRLITTRNANLVVVLYQNSGFAEEE